MIIHHKHKRKYKHITSFLQNILQIVTKKLFIILQEIQKQNDE